MIKVYLLAQLRAYKVLKQYGAFPKGHIQKFQPVALFEHLKHADWRVRLLTAELLSSQNDIHLRKKIVHLFKNSVSIGFRATAIHAFSPNNEGEVKLLIQALEDNPEPVIAMNAIQILAKSTRKGALDTMLHQLEYHPCWTVRQVAVFALADHLEDSRVHKALTISQKSDQHREVRDAARRFLRAVKIPLVPEETFPATIGELRDIFTAPESQQWEKVGALLVMSTGGRNFLTSLLDPQT